MAKWYSGRRTAAGQEVHVLDEAGFRELPLRLDLRNHSPCGFNWGYGGSGPAQLSLALLADALGDDFLAQGLYQLYKAEVVCKIVANEWHMALEEVTAWFEQQDERVAELLDQLNQEKEEIG